MYATCEYDREHINQMKRIAWLLPLYNPCRSKREGCPTINYFHMAIALSQRHIQLHNIKFLHNPRGKLERNVRKLHNQFLNLPGNVFFFSFRSFWCRFVIFFLYVCVYFLPNTCGRCACIKRGALKPVSKLTKKIYELNLTFNKFKIHFSSTMRISQRINSIK